MISGYFRVIELGGKLQLPYFTSGSESERSEALPASDDMESCLLCEEEVGLPPVFASALTLHTEAFEARSTISAEN